MPEPASDSPKSKSTIKFLCSYGGKILPRYPDGKLRYLGGHTRVLSLHRNIPFSELMLKLEELCGTAVRHLRCQLPAEDLDALVSITSDEDLANLIEEYDRAATSSLKIRAFLSQPKSTNKVSVNPPPSLHSRSAYSSSSSSASASSSSSSPSSSPYCSVAGTNGSGYHGYHGFSPRQSYKEAEPCIRQMWPAAGGGKTGGRNIPVRRDGYGGQENPGHVCLIYNGNHWQ
ncbi:hypothetical protein PIB30_093088 [Stylosanthes scabra]|uniref:PB1 domain-containing protein n=1 Tax=Stylosanthes scabra TaxID=79078 RepID=A0ABU6SVF0_9FABA|nr:hypothetical protein [Stylosanthes scabra]